MKYNKFYIQVNNSNQLKKVLDFLSWWKIKFNTEIEHDVFNKSIYLFEKTFWWIKKLDGIVIWNEFCEHLYFNIDKVEDIINWLWNKELIVNTSILTIYNQKYYDNLFILLNSKKINYKVVINDIWFIKLLNKHNLDGKNIIIWRIILKHRKVFNKKNKTINKFSDQSINSNLFKWFFKKYNIESFAIDILPQWNDIKDFKNKYLYFPWWYYTSSRWCVTKSTYSDKNYIYPLKWCERPCIWTYIKFDKQDYLLWKWNSVFYKSIDYIDENNFWKYENFIFQPFLPM